MIDGSESEVFVANDSVFEFSGTEVFKFEPFVVEVLFVELQMTLVGPFVFSNSVTKPVMVVSVVVLSELSLAPVKEVTKSGRLVTLPLVQIDLAAFKVT